MLRLEQLRQTHPTLGEFIGRQGIPDFTVENTGSQGAGLLLYYLKPGKAWICLMKAGGKDAAILGPEPIAKKELTFLRAAKDLQP